MIIKIFPVVDRDTFIMPRRETSGSVGMDVHSPYELTLAPMSLALIPLGFKISIPTGFYVTIQPRSSMGLRGMQVLNGLIDQDFNNQLMALIYNFSPNHNFIRKGDRILQLVGHPYCHIHLSESKEDFKGSRGGFGSTGR